MYILYHFRSNFKNSSTSHNKTLSGIPFLHGEAFSSFKYFNLNYSDFLLKLNLQNVYYNYLSFSATIIPILQELNITTMTLFLIQSSHTHTHPCSSQLNRHWPRNLNLMYCHSRLHSERIFFSSASTSFCLDFILASKMMQLFFIRKQFVTELLLLLSWWWYCRVPLCDILTSVKDNVIVSNCNVSKCLCVCANVENHTETKRSEWNWIECLCWYEVNYVGDAWRCTKRNFMVQNCYKFI